MPKKKKRKTKPSSNQTSILGSKTKIDVSEGTQLNTENKSMI